MTCINLLVITTLFVPIGRGFFLSISYLGGGHFLDILKVLLGKGLDGEP
jgi:hypothetical protein